MALTPHNKPPLGERHGGTCLKPNAEEAETGGSGVQRHPQLQAIETSLGYV